MNAFQITILLILTLFAGCSANGDHSDVVPVTGKITIDSSPASGLRVIFEPEEGRRSIGITDQNGEFDLQYLPDVKGALLGKHTVRVFWDGGEINGDAHTAPTPDDPTTAQPSLYVPTRYNTQSELSVNVGAETNRFDFDLAVKKRK